MSAWTNCANCGKKLKEGVAEFCDDACKTEFDSGDSRKGAAFVSDDAIWNGVWEHITSEPVTITGGRRELIEVCKKHGVMPKALLRPKSRGKGYCMRGDYDNY